MGLLAVRVVPPDAASAIPLNDNAGTSSDGHRKRPIVCVRPGGAAAAAETEVCQLLCRG